MAISNSFRKSIQSFAPDMVLGLGAWAKVALKTHALSRTRVLTKEIARRVRGTSDDPIGIEAFEASLLSQNGEDGIVELVFALIGFNSRRAIEIGFAATEATLLNVAFAHRLHSLFIDGSNDTCRLAAAMFAVMRSPFMSAVNAFITVENVNEVIAKQGFSGEIDALSIDVDGNDYWLMKAIEVVNPRLIVAEYNDRLGPNASISIQYDPLFDFSKSPHDFYQGASLAALNKLAEQRGYRLIGCERSGTNAFFLRSDIDAERIPTKTTLEAFRYHARSVASGYNETERQNIIDSLPFIKI
jgi:hypothetical protein